MIMFCRNCGAELPEGARFCTNCGCDMQADALQERKAAPAMPERPSSYLVLSILTTLFCCMVFGIIGIVYASKVDSAWYAKDYASAREYSRKARLWSLAGILLTVVFWLIYIILIVVGATLPFWILWNNEDAIFTGCFA